MAASSVVPLAGCSETDDDDGDGDAGGDSGGSASSTETLIDDRRNIPEDDAYTQGFELNRRGTLQYSYTVRTGPEIDVFVVSSEEYNAYQSGERFRALSRDSGAGGGDSVTLSQGTYYLVIDNSNAGWVSPPTNFDDDIADVEIEAIVQG